MDDQTELQGTDRLLATLKQAAKQLADTGKPDRRAAEIGLSASRSRAPFRTGRLRASGRSEATGGVGRVEFTAPYALPVHWGSVVRHIEANPFALEGIRESEPRWQLEYMDFLDAAIARIEGV